MKADRDMINKSRVQSCQEFTRLHAGEEKKSSLTLHLIQLSPKLRKSGVSEQGKD